MQLLANLDTGYFLHHQCLISSLRGCSSALIKTFSQKPFYPYSGSPPLAILSPGGHPLLLSTSATTELLTLPFSHLIPFIHYINIW